MITVFYDGKCNLCSKEIAYYQKIAPPGKFIWQDITTSDRTLKENGISLVDGLKQLHAKDETGKIHSGISAFILIWRQLKYWSILATIVRLPILKQLADYAYAIFAHWRFKKLTHCQQAEKEHPKNSKD